MPTYKEQQILDKVCKVTRQKPFFDVQYEKIIFSCQPSHFSPCSAVPAWFIIFIITVMEYSKQRDLHIWRAGIGKVIGKSKLKRISKKMQTCTDHVDLVFVHEDSDANQKGEQEFVLFKQAPAHV